MLNKTMTINEKIEHLQNSSDKLSHVEVEYLHDIKEAFVHLQQKVIRDLVDYKRLSEVCTDNIKDNIRLAETLETIATDGALSSIEIMRLAEKALEGVGIDATKE